MTITGHITEAVFERYSIMDSADVREALIKVGHYATIAERKARRVGAGPMVQRLSTRPFQGRNTGSIPVGAATNRPVGGRYE